MDTLRETEELLCFIEDMDYDCLHDCSFSPPNTIEESHKDNLEPDTLHGSEADMVMSAQGTLSSSFEVCKEPSTVLDIPMAQINRTAFLQEGEKSEELSFCGEFTQGNKQVDVDLCQERSSSPMDGLSFGQHVSSHAEMDEREQECNASKTEHFFDATNIDEEATEDEDMKLNSDCSPQRCESPVLNSWPVFSFENDPLFGRNGLASTRKSPDASIHKQDNVFEESYSGIFGREEGLQGGESQDSEFSPQTTWTPMFISNKSCPVVTPHGPNTCTSTSPPFTNHSRNHDESTKMGPCLLSFENVFNKDEICDIASVMSLDEISQLTLPEWYEQQKNSSSQSQMCPNKVDSFMLSLSSSQSHIYEPMVGTEVVCGPSAETSSIAIPELLEDDIGSFTDQENAGVQQQESPPMRWTPQENELLKLAEETENSSPINWILISTEYFKSKRTNDQCKGRYRKVDTYLSGV